VSIQVDKGEWRSLRDVVRLVVRPELYGVGSSSVGVSGVGSGCVGSSCTASKPHTPELRHQVLRTPAAAYPRVV